MADSAPESVEIKDCESLRAAIAKAEPGNVGHQRLLIKKSIDLGCVDDIPDDWTVEVEK
jgi:hypothetical protein